MEIAGDFSDWQPVALAPAGEGVWRTSLSLAPGVHRVALRINGGDWIAPPGLSAVPDDFVGSAGLLIVR